MDKERRAGVWSVIPPYQRHRTQTLRLEFMGVRILGAPASCSLQHTGNGGLHNLDVEAHTIPVPC